MAVRLLILGASVRAAAWSARRAGFEPVGIDLFADLDLKAVAECQQIAPDAYPHGLATLANQVNCDAWMFTGALENWPELIEQVSRRLPLWGNPPAVLREVRDPLKVAGILRSAGLPCLEVRVGAGHDLPRDGTWIAKPLRSGGSLGVEPVLPGFTPRVPVYFQRIAQGENLSAQFLATRGTARLLGVTRQIVGGDGSHVRYRGNLAPRILDPTTAGIVQRIGSALVEAFPLIGLFGIDFILEGQTPWLLEVNPRYTAAVELLELAQRQSLLRAHAGACVGEELRVHEVAAERHVGREIVYATDDASVVDDLEVPIFSASDPYRLPTIGDVPARGTCFRQGEPMLSIFAQGNSLARVWSELIAGRQAWLDRLQIPREGEEEAPDDEYPS